VLALDQVGELLTDRGGVIGEAILDEHTVAAPDAL
jgi:hypothetical protein